MQVSEIMYAIAREMKEKIGAKKADIRLIEKNFIAKHPKARDQEVEGIFYQEEMLFLAEETASMSVIHPDYARLAGAVAFCASNKAESLREYAHSLMRNTTKEGLKFPLLNQPTFDMIIKYEEKLTEIEKEYRNVNYSYDYFAYQTLAKSYLIKYGDRQETPIQMIIRVACGIFAHLHDPIDQIIETIRFMAEKKFTHASPTLFNSGTTNPQMSSCFLMSMVDDSLPGIFDTLNQAAQISKSGSGLAIHVHNIRGKGSVIKGNNGKSAGIIPMLKVFNETARYVDQAGKRKGAFAIYLEPWHVDIFDFLDLRKNNGAEELRARDLFYGLWVPDLFMERVKADGKWTLFDPSEVRSILGHGLEDVYGDEFIKDYEHLESLGMGKEIKAQDLWKAILEAQTETGNPYMLYKDAVNKKSNQKNIGVIKSSNLCCEITEVSTPDETSVCNLTSIALPTFIKENKGGVIGFDFEEFGKVIKRAVYNMDTVIDTNLYPTEATKKSNDNNRPVGLGVQGLADLFMRLNIAFDSEEAKELNKEIFAFMYYTALTESVRMAKKKGTYPRYEGSPLSMGQFHHELSGEENPIKAVVSYDGSVFPLDWELLRSEINQHGVRNSLLIALMPTATTGQILGNNECFEPYTSNIYVRRTLSGEFALVNKHLVKKLEEVDLWNEKTKQDIIVNNGSVQGIPYISPEIQNIYKTAWEISQKVIVDMSVDRGVYVDQSQSMNIFMAEPNFAKLTSMHFYGWEKGLKTGMYYLRTLPKAQAVKFTVIEEKPKDPIACSIKNPIDCEACGS